MILRSIKRRRNGVMTPSLRIQIQSSANFVELLLCALKGERLPECRVHFVSKQRS
jgi:hypothetical protein